MKHGLNQIKYWCLFEYCYDGNTDAKRHIIIRENRDECQIILDAINKSNINFEVYQIEGIVP